MILIIVCLTLLIFFLLFNECKTNKQRVSKQYYSGHHHLLYNIAWDKIQQNSLELDNISKFSLAELTAEHLKAFFNKKANEKPIDVFHVNRNSKYCAYLETLIHGFAFDDFFAFGALFTGIWPV